MARSKRNPASRTTSTRKTPSRAASTGAAPTGAASEEVARSATPVRLALLGPPGAGKGTQAAALSRMLGIPVVSTGELLRARASQDGEAGRALGAILARGELVDDGVVLELVNAALASPGAEPGYILDGYPRTRAQALDKRTPALDAVVHLSLVDDVTRGRIALRRSASRGAGLDGSHNRSPETDPGGPTGRSGATGGVRSDDQDASAIDNRIEHYHAMTEPLLELYSERGLLVTVDASARVGQVTGAILTELARRGLIDERARSTSAPSP